MLHTAQARRIASGSPFVVRATFPLPSRLGFDQRRLSTCPCSTTLQRLLPLLAFFALSSPPDWASAADPDDRAVPYYTGTVYPTPQSAQYRDEFLPLTNVGLLLGKDVAPEDPRVAVLVERLQRNGVQPRFVASAEDRSETLILVGETGAHEALLGKLAVPAKAEGYLLHSAKNGA